MLKALYSDYTGEIKYHAANGAFSIVVEFTTEEDTKIFLDRSKSVPLKWGEPGAPLSDAQELRLDFDASPEIRKLGGLISVAWRATNARILAAGNPAAGTKLGTKREHGLLQLHSGVRLIDLFKITVPPLGRPTIELHIARSKLPDWLPKETLEAIATEVRSSDDFA